MATQVLSRKQRGEQIQPQDIEQINSETFWEASPAEGGYSVTLFQGKWSCDCPDNRFRGLTCKHIFAVEASMSGVGSSWRFSLGLWEATH